MYASGLAMLSSPLHCKLKEKLPRVTTPLLTYFTLIDKFLFTYRAMILAKLKLDLYLYQK